MDKEIIPFIRSKDFVLVQELAHGSCGKTVLLKDETIDEYFVCKKYSPLDDAMKNELFDNFIREIKILYLLYHRNIVRIFNCYVYPEFKAGFIIMEYVKGKSIEDYLRVYPERINEIFTQVIDGFTYLERENILHRDIRPNNILVDDAGFAKIIDFGFGKQISLPGDYDKSISLNWWCDILPSEFKSHIYDFRTEIYFVGKLFESIIGENEIGAFNYRGILGTMTKVDYLKRIDSFQKINGAILTNKVEELNFSHEEKRIYQTFADEYISIFAKIGKEVQFSTDNERIINRLEKVYKSSMLEDYVQNSQALVLCFLSGGPYTYYKQNKVSVECLKDMLDLLKKSSTDEQNIIINNLVNRLANIERITEEKTEDDNDLPF